MKFFYLVLFTTLIFNLYAQSPNIPLDQDYYHLIDRIDVLSGESKFRSTTKPYSRTSVGKLLDKVTLDNSITHKGNSWLYYENKDYTNTSSTRQHQSLFSKVYKQSANLLSVYDEKLTLHINPLVSASLGRESGTHGGSLYRNSRGFEAFGDIVGKLGFYTSVTENQVIFPTYISNYMENNNVIPGEAFWKEFGDRGVDYFHARGHIAFNLLEPIQLQFGYDRQFIGNGIRSLILSDFSPPSLYLKLTTDVWRISYTNLFRELTADILTSGGVPIGNNTFSKKYMALHHLNIHISKKLDIGLFESVIFQRNDSTGVELNYLNPLIFYRSVEQNLGSPDNALLGFDFKWNFARKFSAYGQLVLDELVVKEVLSGNGWWANKQAGQLGLKYYDALGIEGLDLQGELNIVRPYMYTHTESSTSYTHYRQALAHPMGANFYEMMGVVNYKPLSKFSAKGVLLYSKFGADTATSNYGGNLLLNNADREEGSDYGNKIAQGVTTKLLLLDLTLSYKIRNNWFIDLRQVVRDVSSQDESAEMRSYIIDLGIRLHIGRNNYHF